MNSKKFLEYVKNRRSLYSISNESTLSDDAIIELVQSATKHTPSGHNSQGARVVILLDKEHQTLWDIVFETLSPMLSEKQLPRTRKKIDEFAAGYATLLFFEDQNIVTNLQEKMPTYKDSFPLWSEQSNGMLQYVLWTALESEGMGASLQHYNPLIDEKVKSTWDLPAYWKLIAQMPFGKVTAPADDKTFVPIEERVFVKK